MNKAIGMVEYKSVAIGIEAADTMLKAARIDILEAQTVCPGKYIVLISGDISAVETAVKATKDQFEVHLIDSFVLGNPHDSIFSAMYGTAEIKEIQALGIMETFSAASIIVAADVVAKTSAVELIELRIAKGMCGKSYLLVTGKVEAVNTAIKQAKVEVGEDGMFLESAVIASPHKKLMEKVL